ncbi:DUF3370 domain-containing protein [Oscillatoria sp. FACHB-1406]|uniref:DUF3370 domain-containing protein n=1 Tax=Oscillatoria sp. FACHB-1406 TaxID=2692846 RepID=UPI00168825A6|nr:DUF3370 domain-containing protein [Oscillatoria sp. FACHB-1406]MBD2580111.1 DUF3370 domain-containing protein [Oscillatoria sp. FACHB-1406]
MLSFLPPFALPEIAPAPSSYPIAVQEVNQDLLVPPLSPQEAALLAQRRLVQAQEIRPLPGQLDRVPVFNSNSPEVIYDTGILLSTLPPRGMSDARAHLNYPLQGRFDIFTHHIARGKNSSDWRPIYQGLLVYNPSNRPVTVSVIQGLSYVTNPDAPFIDLPPTVENPRGTIFSGPGSRLTNDILRGLNQSIFPERILIPPKSVQMLFSLPIRLGNARSTLIRLRSDGPVHLASLAMPAPLANPPKLQSGVDPQDLLKVLEMTPIPARPVATRSPRLEEWAQLVVRGSLAYPRDLAPTPLDTKTEETVYGRVAGVALGSQWQTVVADDPIARSLNIPRPGEAFSYPLSTLDGGTLGTGQIQSAPMLVRYPDTAYRAHGNYGIHYYLTLPLSNNSDEQRRVAIAFSTPLKEDDRDDELEFLDPPEDKIFFRGTVQVRYTDDRGATQTQFYHLVQRRGEQGKPLVTLSLSPRDRREVSIDFLYPPDATPPQVLTVSTEL